MQSDLTRRVVAKSGGGIGSIRIETARVPEPRAGEALVRLHAATLNYRDLLAIDDRIAGLAKQPDYVPLSCAAGEVVAVGEGVTRVSPGDRVAPLFDQGWISGGRENQTSRHLGGPIDGVACDMAVFDAEGLAHLPDSIGDLEAATLPCAALTAWHALFVACHTGPGDIVVVQGTGGVSMAALQFAKAAGARVIVTSSSDAKLRRARAMGADHLVNYHDTPDWDQAVLAVTDGRGADVLIDVVGDAQIARSAAALSPDGTIAAIGLLGGDGFSWNLDPGRRVAPIGVGSREEFEAMLRAIDAKGIRPVVDVVYPLDRLGDALTHLESGHFFGKIGISMR